MADPILKIGIAHIFRDTVSRNCIREKRDATCHTAEATLDVLRPVFEDSIISRKADVVWPPRSYDLTPLDYYLWDTVKDECYADKPVTIDTL